MARLRVRQIAESQDVTMSELQRRTGLNFGVLRRYWYNTSNGKEEGVALELVSLVNLHKIASALAVMPNDLIEPIQEEETHVPMFAAA